MHTFLALDLSKASTGFAIWAPNFNRPRSGRWKLGGPMTTRGEVYRNLHMKLKDQFSVHRFSHLFFEEPIAPGALAGATNYDTIMLLVGLAAHAESFGSAARCRVVKAVNVQRWRKDFLGGMAVQDVQRRTRELRKAGNKSASSTKELKSLTIERCRQFDFDPETNDEADALGILTYGIQLSGVTPPWLAAETLRPIIGGPKP